MDKIIFNAKGSEICDKFWKSMGLCCHIFFFILAWYILANIDDILDSDGLEEDFGNFSNYLEKEKHQFQVFVGSWLAYNVIYLFTMGLLIYGIASARHELMLPWLVFEGFSSLALTGTLLCMMLVEVREIFNIYMMVAFGFSITNVFLCPLEVYLWIKYWNIFREIRFSKSVEEKVVSFYNIERGAKAIRDK